MLLAVVLLLIANSITSECHQPQILDRIRSTNDNSQHYSGNLESEEPLLYGFFPAGFMWGAATSALQVWSQALLTLNMKASILEASSGLGCPILSLDDG